MYTYYHKDPSKEPDDVAHFKGRYYQDSNDNKYTDPKTGAHFNYQEICAILETKGTPSKVIRAQKSTQNIHTHHSTIYFHFKTHN